MRADGGAEGGELAKAKKRGVGHDDPLNALQDSQTDVGSHKGAGNIESKYTATSA